MARRTARTRSERSPGPAFARRAAARPRSKQKLPLAGRVLDVLAAMRGWNEEALGRIRFAHPVNHCRRSQGSARFHIPVIKATPPRCGISSAVYAVPGGMVWASTVSLFLAEARRGRASAPRRTAPWMAGTSTCRRRQTIEPVPVAHKIAGDQQCQRAADIRLGLRVIDEQKKACCPPHGDAHA
jgi:hypothetical protein